MQYVFNERGHKNVQKKMNCFELSVGFHDLLEESLHYNQPHHMEAVFFNLFDSQWEFIIVLNCRW